MRKRRQWTSLKGTFDPDDARRVKHTRVGVWDLYEEISPELKDVPGSAKLEQFNGIKQSLPYVWRMLKDLGRLRSCWLLLVSYASITALLSLLPAVALWYSGQMLKIVESAVETRTVDKVLLTRVAAARVAVAIAKRLMGHIKSRTMTLLDQRIKAHYAGHIFEAYARLDVPTSEDPMVQRQLDDASGGRTSVAWDTVQMLANTFSTLLMLVSQVLAELLVSAASLVWAATCRNNEYTKLQGLKRMVIDPSHRKEIVAGNLFERLKAEFYTSQEAVGDYGGDFPELHRRHQLRDRLSSISLLSEPLREIPQIAFTLRAVQYPESIPITLASLHLIQSTVSSFSHSIFAFFDHGSEGYALRNVSFKIEHGQLCVIVGTNGSGKSTILKLISRMYDPTEGDILIDGRNIKSFKLCDLRRAISVLFQDYTHFPLSIKDNIMLGDPDRPFDEDRLEQATKAGGAYDFINNLPDGLDTYLNRPVSDYYSPMPEGTTSLFGRPLDHSRVRKMGGMGASESSQLSGGQMQRLAVSRTFMRSLAADSEVGLLLFDEPSASLDPQAEHDLFERLRALRGNKTMIFSSHRFGNLTRHADVILYMRDSIVEEMGTHESLLKRRGGYANVYTLQAQAFLS
ncbi:hypothetical protein EW145_g713 [Phellinidium pouzarii]|uniref:ABC transporter domain-containing protein n=1 Tax=Phellinidium pouzarii TaxID=167371 RepID=A0A4V3XDW8_9AGAM|nr:hypothetical protein EW145_g713 [Phellinidium pouzarii]